MSFGWVNETVCSHSGTWSADSVAGYGIMYCSGCGKSFYLWQKESDGSLVWMPMVRLNEEEAKSVVDLEQTVQPVQRDEDERPVLPESDETKRAGRLLQAMPEREQPAVGGSLAGSTGETDCARETLLNVQTDEASKSVSPRCDKAHWDKRKV